MYAETYDARGNMEPGEKWPVLQEEFAFNFNIKDVPTILKNRDAAEEVIKKSGFRKIRQ